MSTSKIVVLLAALLLPAPAFAARLSCVSLDALDKRTEECKDNPQYTKAGQECLKKFEEFIARAAGIPVGSVRHGEDITKPLSSSQKEQINAAGKMAKKRVSDYRDNIYYPEDWDAPEELIGDPMDFFDSEPCYAKARDSLQKAEDKIDVLVKKFGK